MDAPPMNTPAPPVSVTEAVAIGAVLTVLYILGYYVSHRKALRRPSANGSAASPSSGGGSPDPILVDPSVVRNRLATIVASCVLAAVLLYLGVYTARIVPAGSGQGSVSEFLSLLGVRWPRLALAVLVAPLPVVALFLGPLVHMYVERELFFQDPVTLSLFLHQLRTPGGQRSYFLGPVCEEFMFRACIALPFQAARVSKGAIVGLTPLFFGAAHLHNIYDVYRRHGRTLDALRRAVTVSVFQFLYTTLFGWIAAFIYVRTGHVISAMLAHIFCNIMGVPNIAEVHLSRHPRVIWAAYVLGLALFFALAGPLTSPAMYQNAVFADA
ncbi:CAAX prenyl protease [Blastocladiella emersonii ATCC 22665]|nr:CAAX prenyl protease [Blastocladiella emersonii ATCC 22665]